MKNIFLFLLLHCALFVNAQTTAYKTYSKNGFGAFSISYPSTWKVTENPSQGVAVSIMEPENGDNFMTNFNIIVSNRDIALNEKITVSSEEQLKRVFHDFTVQSKEFFQINGKKTLKISASCTMYGYPVKQVQFATKNGTTLYVVSFTVATDQYTKQSKNINYIINSLNIK